ncbi:MAG: NAD(P)/FAD-dependent oxidoreductase [Rhizobiaceae bacterium]|nr:NAD(P)/FAD-dependent oxidoreductase [Rhizobiaceae bacterium]
MEIAVVGSGVSGLSAAWLLSKRHRVTLYEADDRLGGHSNTVDCRGTPVDTGFIVYNEVTYPNLTAMFRHLAIPTKPSDMSFAVSLDDGRLEYSGSGLGGLFAQAGNIVRPRFWRMLQELIRFYREAPRDMARMGDITLAAYLDAKGYGTAFREDHLYPMAAAIWSTPAADIGRYPAVAFIRFCQNHGLLKLANRPAWRTVDGGSRLYVRRLAAGLADRIRTGSAARTLLRDGNGVEIVDMRGRRDRFDHVVLATHADQALGMLDRPSREEQRILGRFGYTRNEAVLHCDPALMPRARRVWSSWNYLSSEREGTRALSVTYWMNRLQGIPASTPLFVTLNPNIEPRPDSVIRHETYRHPIFDGDALQAQQSLWSLQGVGRTWFCGAYFGAGFHEDGLQAGLAVAEQLSGVRRPWQVADESGRIVIGRPAAERHERHAA